MADPRKFIYSSDWPTPYMVWKSETNFVTNPRVATRYSIPHNLPFIPLLVGQWSLNPEFKPAYDLSMVDTTYEGISYTLQISATDTEVLFTAFNTDYSQKTFYVRLFSFMPPDFEGIVPPVADSSNFTFNSEFNSPKIIYQGKSEEYNLTINHNLGYRPIVRAWSINDSSVYSVAPISYPQCQRGVYHDMINSTDTDVQFIDILSDGFYYMVLGNEGL